MANQVQIGGQVTVVSGLLRNIFGLSDQFTTTGSNFISNNASVNTGSWQIVDQASNTNFRYGFFTNTDATSSCKIAINTTATSSYSAYLQPGDVCIIPNSGSCVIYAQAVGANSPIILQYLLVES